MIQNKPVHDYLIPKNKVDCLNIGLTSLIPYIVLDYY